VTGSIRIGTSGWVYGHWRDVFYPRRLPQSRWFTHYAGHFQTFEINATFYREPREAAVEAWRDQAPPGFVYAVKAHRFMTHPVTMVTLAPELDDADQLIDALTERRIVVSLGHSDASATVAHAAFDAGAVAVSHLFNAMRPFHHRDPGLAGAALSRSDVTVMLVADGTHIASDALLAAVGAARGRLVLVSDAIAAAACGDGTFSLGDRDVMVEDGVARLADGTLAGSTRPLAWGLRLLVELGVPVAEAVDAVTRTPARLLGRQDVAVLRPGAPADVVVLDDAFAVERVYVGGAEITRER
jgi:N-acetylglucosamine-6-phosphate deacetylase